MIRNVKNWFGLWICMLVSASASNALGQSDELKWKLNVDDQFTIVLVQKSNSLTKVDARETTVDSANTIKMDWVVTSVAPNGDATMEQSLTSVELSVTGFTQKKKGETASPLMTIAFDTAAPADITKESKKLMNQILPLLGLKFNVVMSPLGEIKKVTIPDEVAAVLNKMPDTQNLRALFSEDGLKDIMGATAIVLPEELTEGQSWTSESNSSTAMGNFDQKRTYTFVGKKTVEGTEVAEFSVAVALEPSDVAPTELSASSLKSKLIEFTGSGILLMDIKGGFFQAGKIENRAHTEKPYREKTIDTVVTNQIEMTVTRK